MSINISIPTPNTASEFLVMTALMGAGACGGLFFGVLVSAFSGGLLGGPRISQERANATMMSSAFAGALLGFGMFCAAKATFTPSMISVPAQNYAGFSG